MTWKEMLNRLTSNYKLTGNIKKLFRILGDEIDGIKSSIETTEKYRDLDQAEGKTLDRIGRNLLEFRGQLDDEKYREMIKTKIIANRSGGDLPTVIEIAKVLIGDALVSVQEVWSIRDELYPKNDLYPLVDLYPQSFFYEALNQNEPAAILITIDNRDGAKFPFGSITRTVAGGVSVFYFLTDKTEEGLSWTESVSINKTVCPLPSNTLYLSDDLYPC